MYAVPKALSGFLHQSVLTYKGLGFSRIVLLWRPLLAQERNCRLGFTRWSVLPDFRSMFHVFFFHLTLT